MEGKNEGRKKGKDEGKREEEEERKEGTKPLQTNIIQSAVRILLIVMFVITMFNSRY